MTDLPVPRGQLVVDNYLLSVFGDKVTRTLANGDLEVLDGTGTIAVPGTGPVTMARNMRLPLPDVVMVADGFAFHIDIAAKTVAPYPLSTDFTPPALPPQLGAVNSVDYFSGYFVFSRSSGEIIATELQQMDWKVLSENRAEANPDGLLRVFGAQPILLACGKTTIEVYQDVGSQPFPYQRVTVIPCGLIGTWAIAGGASQWDRPVVLVAHDRTVRELRGHEPVIISNEDVVADIEDVAHAGLSEQLYAQVYTHGDNAIWSLSSPTWTWEYNLSTGAWHRRRSFQPDAPTPEDVPWRSYFAARFDHRWLAQDVIDGGIIEITGEAMTEPPITRLREVHGPDPEVPLMVPTQLNAPLIIRCESGPVKEVPANVRAAAMYFDYTVGFDVVGVPDPAVFLSWSHDGGATWSNPLERRVGGKGEFRTLVTLRSTGRSSHQGIRVRWECVDPIPISFHGAISPRTTASRPKQVDVVHPPLTPPFGKVPGGAGGS